MNKKHLFGIALVAAALSFSPALPIMSPNVCAAASTEDASMAQAHYEQGQHLLQIRQFDEAMNEFDQALKLDDSQADIYAARANLYFIIGNRQVRNALNKGVLSEAMRGPFLQSMRDYTSAIDLDPKETSYYRARGIVYRILGEYDRALADFNKIITMLPNDFSIYDRRAECYADMGDYDHALADLDTALKLNPKDYMNSYYRGVVYARQGNYDKALQNFDQAAKISKWFAEPWLMMGIIYEQKGNDYDAVYAYSQFLTRDKANNRPTVEFVKERLEDLTKTK